MDTTAPGSPRPSRRRWLKAGSAALPALALASITMTARARAEGPSTGQRIAADAAATDPAQAWPQAFEPPRETWGPIETRMSRPLPAGFGGTLYRNGPGRMTRGDTRYRHWFDGDGLIQAFRFDDDHVRHHARMIRTDKYRREEAAGRFVFHGYGTAIPGARPAPTPDHVNVANIAVLPIGGELLALWEAGSPWRIDPVTLETRGRKVWSDDTDGVAFSAHPKRDRDGSVWSFGYLPGSGRLVLYHLAADGSLRSTAVIASDRADLVHDFAITDRWLVFVLMPLVHDPEHRHGDGAFITRYRWDGAHGGQVLLVDKRDLATTRRIDMPALPHFHIGNAFDDGAAVRIQLARTGDFIDLLDRFRDSFEGRTRDFSATTGTTTPGLAGLIVDPGAGRARVETIADLPVDFPSVDPRRIGRRARWLTMVARSDAMPTGLFGFDSVVRIDIERGTIGRFTYAPGLLAEEHLFVPGTGDEASGWVVGTALDWRRRETVVSIFDAAAIDAGPITDVRLPYGLPPGLHGSFVAAPAG